jgi:hypothetical protein
VTRRARTSPSIAKIASATQMQAKPIARSRSKASLKKNTPSRNWSVGAMYCSSPTTDSGTRRTA